MLRVANCPSQELALTNAAFVSPSDSDFVPYAELGDLVLFTRPHPEVEPGQIALNGVQRKLLRVSTGDTVRVEPFTPPTTQFNAAGMTLELEFTKLRTATDLNAAGRHEQVRTRASSSLPPPTRSPFMTHPRPTVIRIPNSFVSEQVDAVKMAESIKRAFVSQVFTVGQKAAVEYCGNNFLITVNSMLVENSPDGVRNSRGCMIPDTGLIFEAAHNSAIKITNQKVTTVNSSLFKAKEFSFEKLGIGGLGHAVRRHLQTSVFIPGVSPERGATTGYQARQGYAAARPARYR